MMSRIVLILLGMVFWVTPQPLGAARYSRSVTVFRYTVLIKDYLPFLNAVGFDDFYSLYNSSLVTDSDVAPIFQHGKSGSYWYDTLPRNEKMPVMYVSAQSQLYYVRWINHGAPSPLNTEERSEILEHDLFFDSPAEKKDFLASGRTLVELPNDPVLSVRSDNCTPFVLQIDQAGDVGDFTPPADDGIASEEPQKDSGWGGVEVGTALVGVALLVGGGYYGSRCYSQSGELGLEKDISKEEGSNDRFLMQERANHQNQTTCYGSMDSYNPGNSSSTRDGLYSASTSAGGFSGNSVNGRLVLEDPQNIRRSHQENDQGREADQVVSESFRGVSWGVSPRVAYRDNPMERLGWLAYDAHKQLQFKDTVEATKGYWRAFAQLYDDLLDLDAVEQFFRNKQKHYISKYQSFIDRYDAAKQQLVNYLLKINGLHSDQSLDPKGLLIPHRLDLIYDRILLEQSRMVEPSLEESHKNERLLERWNHKAGCYRNVLTAARKPIVHLNNILWSLDQKNLLLASIEEISYHYSSHYLFSYPQRWQQKYSDEELLSRWCHINACYKILLSLEALEKIIAPASAQDDIAYYSKRYPISEKEFVDFLGHDEQGANLSRDDMLVFSRKQSLEKIFSLLQVQKRWLKSLPNLSSLSKDTFSKKNILSDKK